MAKTKITLPGGQVVEGEEVDVVDNSSTERWSDYTLSDGATIRIKTVVSSIVRLEGQFDGEGNPLYVIKSTPAVVVRSVPETLKARRN